MVGPRLAASGGLTPSPVGTTPTAAPMLTVGPAQPGPCALAPTPLVAPTLGAPALASSVLNATPSSATSFGTAATASTPIAGTVIAGITLPPQGVDLGGTTAQRLQRIRALEAQLRALKEIKASLRRRKEGDAKLEESVGYDREALQALARQAAENPAPAEPPVPLMDPPPTPDAVAPAALEGGDNAASASSGAVGASSILDTDETVNARGSQPQWTADTPGTDPSFTGSSPIAPSVLDREALERLNRQALQARDLAHGAALDASAPSSAAATGRQLSARPWVTEIRGGEDQQVPPGGTPPMTAPPQETNGQAEASTGIEASEPQSSLAKEVAEAEGAILERLGAKAGTFGRHVVMPMRPSPWVTEIRAAPKGGLPQQTAFSMDMQAESPEARAGALAAAAASQRQIFLPPKSEQLATREEDRCGRRGDRATSRSRSQSRSRSRNRRRSRDRRDRGSSRKRPASKERGGRGRAGRRRSRSRSSPARKPTGGAQASEAKKARANKFDVVEPDPADAAVSKKSRTSRFDVTEPDPVEALARSSLFNNQITLHMSASQIRAIIGHGGQIINDLRATNGDHIQILHTRGDDFGTVAIAGMNAPKTEVLIREVLSMNGIPLLDKG